MGNIESDRPSILPSLPDSTDVCHDGDWSCLWTPSSASALPLLFSFFPVFPVFPVFQVLVHLATGFFLLRTFVSLVRSHRTVRSAVDVLSTFTDVPLLTMTVGPMKYLRGRSDRDYASSEAPQKSYDENSENSAITSSTETDGGDREYVNVSTSTTLSVGPETEVASCRKEQWVVPTIPQDAHAGCHRTEVPQNIPNPPSTKGVLAAIDEALRSLDPDFYQLYCCPVSTSATFEEGRVDVSTKPPPLIERSEMLQRSTTSHGVDSGNDRVPVPVPVPVAASEEPSDVFLCGAIVPHDNGASAQDLLLSCNACADPEEVVEGGDSVFVPRGDDDPTHMMGLGPPPDPSMWAQVGHLTEAEYHVYLEFKEWIFTQPRHFITTVFHYGLPEPMEYGLCRWLRARKFKIQDVKTMVAEAADISKDAREDGFYPDAQKALGAPAPVFLTQYPQLYCGCAKNGCPIFISKPGMLNVQGMECMTTLNGIIRYHWHAMMHDFTNRLAERRKNNPDFNRFECLCVLDLSGLRASSLNKRALNIIKTQTAIDSLCFPETMNRMMIVNAPGFFAFTWKIIRGWIDARTAAKVEIISNRKQMERRFLELCDPDQVPSDYGGTAEPTAEVLMRGGGGVLRAFDHILTRGATEYTFALEREEEWAEIWIFTRCTTGTTIGLYDENGGAVVTPKEVRHVGPNGENDEPTKFVLASAVKGPGKFKISANYVGSSSEYYLIFGNITDDMTRKEQQPDVAILEGDPRDTANIENRADVRENFNKSSQAFQGVQTLQESAEIHMDGAVHLLCNKN